MNQISIEGTRGMGTGHRGFSQRLHREAYFDGSSPNDEFNEIVFVYSDTRWE